MSATQTAPLAHPNYTKGAAALTRFTFLRLQAAAILEQAAKIDGLSPLHQAQAIAGAKLAGIRLHRPHGQASADDAQALIGDLFAVCGIVDALIDAMGFEAAQNFHNIDRDCFRDQLRGALDGNATFELQCAAEMLGADDDAPSIDATREHRTHAGSV